MDGGNGGAFCGCLGFGLAGVEEVRGKGTGRGKGWGIGEVG